MRSEGLCQWKIPMTPFRIELATFRFVAQHLNRCATAVPNYPTVRTLFARQWYSETCLKGELGRNLSLVENFYSPRIWSPEYQESLWHGTCVNGKNSDPCCSVVDRIHCTSFVWYIYQPFSNLTYSDVAWIMAFWAFTQCSLSSFFGNNFACIFMVTEIVSVGCLNPGGSVDYIRRLQNTLD